MSSRYELSIRYGRTLMPCRGFETYRAARRYQRALRMPSVLRLIPTGRECFLFAVLLCVSLGAMLGAAL